MLDFTIYCIVFYKRTLLISDVPNNTLRETQSWVRGMASAFPVLTRPQENVRQRRDLHSLVPALVLRRLMSYLSPCHSVCSGSTGLVLPQTSKPAPACDLWLAVPSTGNMYVSWERCDSLSHCIPVPICLWPWQQCLPQYLKHRLQALSFIQLSSFKVLLSTWKHFPLMCLHVVSPLEWKHCSIPGAWDSGEPLNMCVCPWPSSLFPFVRDPWKCNPRPTDGPRGSVVQSSLLSVTQGLATLFLLPSWFLLFISLENFQPLFGTQSQYLTLRDTFLPRAHPGGWSVLCTLWPGSCVLTYPECHTVQEGLAPVCVPPDPSSLKALTPSCRCSCGS